MSVVSTATCTGMIEHDVMLLALRQLILSLRPFLRDAATAEQVEEAVIRLEENDKRFHKYNLVKLVRAAMEEKLGALIEEEIERGTVGHTQSMGQDTLVEQIVEKVVNSSQYADVMKMLKKSAGDCIDQLSRNFDEEFVTAAATNQELSNIQAKQHVYSFSDDESSFGSSMNQSSFMFMNQEQFNQIAVNLEKKKTLSVRRQALTTLSQIPPMDIHGTEQWSVLRSGILAALSDPDEQLYALSIKFCARGFSSSSTHTREVYSTLVEHLMLQFNSRKSSIPKLQNGLDIRASDVTRVIKAFRLLHDFQLRIPSYWVRQSPKFLDELLESTLMLISIRHSGVDGTFQTSPIHILSLLDPKASWFVKWMHGNYSRQPLLAMLKKYRSIVDGAVRHCMKYVRDRRQSGIDELSHALAREHIGDSVRMTYTAEELEYAYFVNSISMVGKLLFYKAGRSFFPIKVKEPEEPVTITSFLVAMIGLIHKASTMSKQASAPFDPVNLVMDLLREKCLSDASLDMCLCQDDVTSALLAPLADWLAVKVPNVKDVAFIYIADIVSMIAASSRGRHHLLYGRGKTMFSNNTSSAAHLIARFTHQALEEKLANQTAGFPSRAVFSAFMYNCRQLYSDSEGLMVMSKYDIYQVISNAWRQACREADMAATPTPSEPSSSPSGASQKKEAQNVLLWEDTLRDNLLNFAATPRGVLLLQLTGAMNDCVYYMYTRYAKKLQVSKCEKFGYGFMLTQVAATSPGMVALQNTGFMETLIAEVWYSLEPGTDESPVAPKVWPVHPIDASVHKPLLSLLNMLSSFPAVYELLANKALPSKKQYSIREVPSGLVDLLDRLVFIDSLAKFAALFNYEQSHVFGLRLLAVMTTCLDTCLLLESQYKFQGYLLKSQEENISGDSKSEIIIDMLSVERNFILVKTFVVGGPTEKVVPTRVLSEDRSNPYPYPMFGALPVPKLYTQRLSGANLVLKPDNELSRFLAESKATEHNLAWLDRCKKAFCGVLSTKPEQATASLLMEMLDRVVPILLQIKDEAVFPLAQYTVNESSIKATELSSTTMLGIQYTIRYGQHLNLLESGSTSTDKLAALLRQVTNFLQQHRRSPSTQYRYSDGDYKGYDWFAATMFLLMGGSEEKTWKLLHKMSALLSSAFLWPARAHLTTHFGAELSECGIPAVFHCTGHAVEMLLQAEVSAVYSAFRMSGYTPSQICQHWFRQCLWNYLDWLDICHYICLCLLLGADYQVYVCVALLKHLQSGIIERMQSHDLMVFLKEEAIPSFRLGNHLEFMQQLEKKYRKFILPGMASIANT